MYRIRLASGEQAVFRTVEELTLAVQSGVVGPTAEVYLPDANRWMQMESHPDFQAARVKPASAESLAESPSLPQPVTQPPVSLAPIPLAETTPPPSPAPAPTQLSAPSSPTVPVGPPQPASTEAPEAGSTATPQAPPALPPSVFMTRARKLREMLAMHLGLLLVIGASVLLTIYLAGNGKRLFAAAHEGMTPPASARPASAPAPAPVAPVEEASADSAAAELERAGIPKRDTPRRERETLAAAPTLDSYETGYADARDELEDALDYIRFDHVFAPVRLKSAEAVRITRRSIAAAGNIVMTYRAREVMLEQTVGATRSATRSQRESYQAGAAVRDMLEDSDSLYALLMSQAVFAGGRLDLLYQPHRRHDMEPGSGPSHRYGSGMARLDRHRRRGDRASHGPRPHRPASPARQIATFPAPRPPRVMALYSRAERGYPLLPLGPHVSYPPRYWRRSRLPLD